MHSLSRFSGAQTLSVGFTDLGDFAYLGIFSSGIFGRPRRGSDDADRPDPIATWEAKFQKSFDDPELKKGLRLVWFATGKNDFLLPATRSTVELLKKHGFDVTLNETKGGHTWLNWRDHLNEFAQLLFTDNT